MKLDLWTHSVGMCSLSASGIYLFFHYIDVFYELNSVTWFVYLFI